MLNIVLNYFYVCFFLISTTWLKNELEFASEVLLVKHIVLTLRKTPRQVPYCSLYLNIQIMLTYVLKFAICHIHVRNSTLYNISSTIYALKMCKSDFVPVNSEIMIYHTPCSMDMRSIDMLLLLLLIPEMIQIGQNPAF